MEDWCHTSTHYDWETIVAREKHEGLSFLTITLPSFASDLQKGLARGYVDHDLFRSFAFRGGLPRFLGGFLDLVFDRTNGRLLDEPSSEAIFAIRQITMLFGKIQLPCSDARVAAAIDSYIKCEQEVVEADARRSAENYADFKRVSALLWADTFQKVDEDIYYGRVVPKHGPGATADRLAGNRKYDQAEWTTRLEQVFPAGEYLFPNWSYYKDLQDIHFLEPGAERPVRVITVPKTLKTPRIIAIEPTCMQYMQQAVLEPLVEYIESSSTLIGFTDQAPNQDLARIGSLNGELATLDLSEASDRVSNQLVRAMFEQFPNLFEAVDATRSRKADVNGKVIRLAKFASMGSALCFPVEALVFSTLIFMGIQDELNRPLTKKDIQSFEGLVRVYGDDIIVPVRYVSSVISRLEEFGFKVNAGKSFWTGRFRESCGKDYYGGDDITVVRCRREFPTSRRDVQELLSLVSLRNQFYLRGMWQTVRWLDAEVERVIPFPAVLATSPALGKLSCLGHETHKMSATLHKPMVKAYVQRGQAPESKLEGSGALMKFFLKRGFEPHADVKHLERYGRPDAVDIKLGWASAV
jgi:hypothetical protein